MRRREFIGLVGGAAAAWPLTVRAQAPERMRRLGVLVPFSEIDAEGQARLEAFKQRLQDFGWTDGRNIQFISRFTGSNSERIRAGALELVALMPDVIVVANDPAVAAVRQATQVIPIVFTQVSDSVGSGFVSNLARPDGNVTGFHNFEPPIGGKWLEILKQIAPEIHRVGFVHVPEIAPNVAFLHAAETASTSLGVKLAAISVRNAEDIEPALTAFAREPNGGLIVAPSPINTLTRERIIALAARLRLPTIYPYSFFPEIGGLVSYGVNPTEKWREVASYVDRILRGAKPADLPVQQPTKYETIVNLKTAKALGLTVPSGFLVGADQVIE